MMKSRYCFQFLIFFLCIGGIFFLRQPWARGGIQELEKTPLPQIQVPPIFREKMKNGMRLLLLEDEELPLVRGYLYIRTGSIYESPEKLGLAALTGQLLRAGGTEGLSPETFNEKLAGLGAEISSSVNREYGFVSFQCLKEDFPVVLGLVFEMLRKPAFDEAQRQLIKSQMLEALKRKNDDPEDIAQRIFPKLIFGKDNPWSRTPTPETVQHLSRGDVLEFYRKYYFPDRIVFALAGDVRPKEAMALIEAQTRDWPKANGKLPVVPPLKKTWEAGLYLGGKKTDQATLLLGHFGEKRSNPDKFALLLLNEILGGDVMSSRLGKRIRSTLGLSYGIFSQYGLQTDYGIFLIFAQTKAPSATQVLAEAKKILEETVSHGGVGEGELELHKQSLLNSLFSEYEPKYKFAQQEARFEYLGYPPNYLQILRKKIEKVTLKDIQRVAKTYLRPDALKVLVVGDPAQVGSGPEAQPVDIEAW